MKFEQSYLVQLSYLGFRYHGWQKQEKVKTLHQMVDKTLTFVLTDQVFKSHGVGRTDAKVSAATYYFQLFTNEKLNKDLFLASFNSNLPYDIKASSIQQVALDFNIIKHPKLKEYLYFFSMGQKIHPFCAPLMLGLEENLDIELMKKGAELFEGEHCFHKYCTKPSKNTEFIRLIQTCEIVVNDIYTANFFPRTSYYLRVKGAGFMRYQIRLMMAVLFELGRGNIDLDYIKNSLKASNDRQPLKKIAPGSGLQLYNIEFFT